MIQVVFDKASELPESEQPEYVRTACSGDAELITEVQSLLSAIEGGEQELERSPVAEALAQPCDGDLLPPVDAIPGYRIKEELHRGGQGIVYQAVQLSTKREVALKVMLDGPFAGPASKRRFEREVELVASLRHHGIVPVFDSGIAHGSYYFAMEYIRGDVLNQYVGTQKLSKEQVLHLFRQICDAMAYAHNKGVIHRDLKPSNILVDETGAPRIVDFGLAKVGGTAVDQNPALLVSVTGQVMGTPAYMSPEQAAGNPDLVDMRSDVYSLGIVLYELLTGQPPHKVDSVPDNLRRIQFDAPPGLRSLDGAIDRDVETIVAKAISIDRTRRYPTAGALGEDIGRFLAGDPIEARRDSLSYLLRKAIAKHFAAAALMAGVGILLVAALITGWALYWSGETARARLSDLSIDLTRERDKARELRAESQKQLYVAHMNLAAQALIESGGIGRVEELTDLYVGSHDLGWEWFYLRSRCNQGREPFSVEKAIWAGAFSPEGKYFAAGGDGGRLLLYRTDDPADYTDIGTHNGQIRAIEWSPDGRWLASSSPNGTVFVFDTRTRRKLHTFRIKDHALALAWHPEKPILAVGSRDKTVTRWNVETGDRIDKTYTARASIQTMDYSPDGKLLVLGTWNTRGSAEVWDAEGDKHLFNLDRKHSVFATSFSPDGRLLATSDTDGKLIVSPTSKLHKGKPVWTRSLGRPAWAIAWSPDGSAIATAGEDRLVQIWNAASGDPIRSYEGHTAPIWLLDWSKDGQTILTGSHDRTLRLWNAHSARQDRVFVPQPKNRPAFESVSWSPDGRNIAMAGQAHEIFVIDHLAGERVTDLQVGIRANETDWSPNGTKIVVAHDQGLSWWDINEPDKVHDLDPHRRLALSAQWSPDSRSIATCGRTGAVNIWDANSRELIHSFAAHSVHCDVAWSPKADRLAIAAFDGAKIIHIADSQERILLDSDRTCRTVAWSPDGTRVAVGGESGKITIHNADGGAAIHTMNEHVARVRCVVWHPSGTRLASASDDGTIRLWDPKTGLQTLLLRGHEGQVRGLDWSPDGMALVSAGADSQIRFWDATAGSAD